MANRYITKVGPNGPDVRIHLAGPEKDVDLFMGLLNNIGGVRVANELPDEEPTELPIEKREDVPATPAEPHNEPEASQS